MGLFAEEAKKEEKKEEQEVTNNDKLLSDDDIEKWLFSESDTKEKFVCLIIGKDGTAKSPLALSYLTDNDIKEGKRALIIDLDGGVYPLLKYHKERCEKYDRKPSDVYIVKNPLSIKNDNGEFEPDYLMTINKIMGIVQWLSKERNRKKYNIKYVVLDGLSTLLKIAENQMRVEKNITADGGVSLRFWLIRNKLFLETIELIKALPISSFFIGHEEFILKENDENSSVIIKTSSAMHQKIITSKEFVTKDKAIFKAKIIKSKYDITKEGKEIIFGEVIRTSDGENYVFEPEKVLEGLI